MPSFNRKSYAMVFACVFLISAIWGIAKPQKAAAQRTNTAHACRRSATIASQGRLPGGLSYVTFEYGVFGNDYGRRFLNSSGVMVGDANQSWFNDSGSGCSDAGLSALYWDG